MSILTFSEKKISWFWAHFSHLEYFIIYPICHNFKVPREPSVHLAAVHQPALRAQPGCDLGVGGPSVASSLVRRLLSMATQSQASSRRSRGCKSAQGERA